jgi:glutamate N-acetyltransferase / amino-acid N-acetyltransferase
MLTETDQNSAEGITFPRGFRAGAVRAGLKTEGDDLVLILSDRPAAAAGVFTTNQFRASSVDWCSQLMKSGDGRAIFCNAGNANACTGVPGLLDTVRIAEAVGRALGVDRNEVFVASTGIIGVPMPMEKVNAGIDRAAKELGSGRDVDNRVSRAIMTTDLVPKQTAARFQSDAWDGEVRFGGVCKGSGMIAPAMAPPHATMLCFVTTDASVGPDLLQKALTHAAGRTFNRITVDGDTSTNDMLLLLANGASGVSIQDEGPAYEDFVTALEQVCLTLAKEVARDGEGATKLVEIVILGAETEADALKIARTVAESPLVKTALYGCDPNWGRFLMAAGRAGVQIEPSEVTVKIGDILVFQEKGVPFDEAAAHAYLRQKEVRVEIDLSMGEASATMWTCDYSYDYIKINADYHT